MKIEKGNNKEFRIILERDEDLLALYWKMRDSTQMFKSEEEIINTLFNSIHAEISERSLISHPRENITWIQSGGIQKRSWDWLSITNSLILIRT